MPHIEKDLFGEARSRITRSWVETTFPASGAKWSGRNWLTTNPCRDDSHSGSFSVTDKGWVTDYADDGFNSNHKDVFDVLATLHGIEPIEVVCQMLGIEREPKRIYDAEKKSDEGLIPASSDSESQRVILGSSVEQPAVAIDPSPCVSQPPAIISPAFCPDDNVTSIDEGRAPWLPIPEDVVPPSYPGTECITLYYDLATSNPVFFVVRFRNKEGKKVTFPKYWDGEKLVNGIPPDYHSRPLLPVPRNTHVVVIVEGELKCQRLDAFFREKDINFVATCWYGGANQAEHVDLREMRDRIVVLWPDNDEAGKKAMAIIARRLGETGAAGVMRINPPENKEQGWDCADALDEGIDIVSMLEGAEEWLDHTPKVEPRDASGLDFEMTDLGNSERFVALFGHAVRYNSERRRWMTFFDRVWHQDNVSDMTPLVKEAINQIASDSRFDSKERYNFACKTESLPRINAMLELASREPGIPISESELDGDPYIFNCRNTAIDLRTGKEIVVVPSMLISLQAPVDYDPEARCPRFMSFLSEITCEREEIQEFLRRWFGACLSGDTSPQTFAIFYGSGANGKSTLVDVIYRIMGRYAKQAAPDMFVTKSNGQGGIPNDIADLRGARCVLTSETEQGAKLAESKVKTMTGGEAVKARFLHGEFFEFRPNWKIIMSTNHRPKVTGSDHGIWRRIVLVPFDFIATGDRLDPNLPKKLWEERSGILNWAVSGAVDFFRDGGGRTALKIPDAVGDETDQYRTDEDVIGRWIVESCLPQDSVRNYGLDKVRILLANLHRSFVQWAERENEIAACRMSSSAFAKALSERGINSVKFSGIRFYFGIVPSDCVDNEGRLINA